MRRIEIIPDVYLRFPTTSAEFDLGLEVGAIAVQMANGEPLIQRTLSTQCVDLLRPLAERFRYALVSSPSPDGVIISLIHWNGRPQLRVVR